MAKKRILKVLDVGARDKRTKSTTQKAAHVLDEFAPSVVAQKMGISTQKLTGIKKQINSGKLYSPELRDFLRSVGNKLLGIKSKEEIEFEKFLKSEGLTKKEFKKQQKELEQEIKKEESAPTGGVAGDEVVKVGKEKRIQYRGGKEGEEGKEGGVYYYKYHEDLLKDAPESKVVKTVGDYKQARAWWGEIGGGSVYFVISRVKATGKGNEGKYKYQVVDIRTNDERNNRKGKLSGAAQAREQIERAQEIFRNHKAGKE